MPVIESPKSRPKVWKWVIVFLATVLVLVLAGFLAYWMMAPAPDDAIKQAEKFSAQNNPQKSYEILKRANTPLLGKDDRVVVMGRLAGILIQIGKKDEAFAYQEKLLAMDPDDYATQLQTADLARQLGKNKLAIELYKKCLTQLKNSPKGQMTEYMITVDEDYIKELEKKQ